MKDLNIISILYISFRLAPFILVSFFSLSSIFNQDFKGLIYLSGLLITCFVAIIVSNTNASYFSNITQTNTVDNLYEETTKVCNLLTLSKSGPISKIPLSQIVFAFTFFYLLTPIIKYRLVSQNIPTLVIFPILIVSDIIWNYSNECTTAFASFIAVLIGCLCGFLWSSFIESTKLSSLQYFNGISNKQTCSAPSKQVFRCKKSRVA
jgi:hypothetical protein